VRIEGWRVDGFGVLSGFEMGGLAPGLTVVLGPNEAGKSTLLDFLRGVLAGFPDARKRLPRHEPLRGGRHGGAVHLVDGAGRRFTVERHVGERSARVLARDGDPATEQAALHLLARVDAAVLRSVFAFGLTELQALGSLAEDEVRDLLFSAGVLGAGRSATAAVRTLGDERTKIVRARHADARANRALLQLQELDRQLATARDEALRYPELGRELDRLGSAVDAARRRLDTVRRRSADLDRFVALWPAWRRREDALARLSDGSAEAARDSLEQVRRLSPRTAALAAELAGHDARGERCTELEHSRSVLAEQVSGLLERLGPGWDIDRARAVDTSIAALDAVREHGRRTTGTASAVGFLTHRAHEARAAAERSQAEREAATGGGPPPRPMVEIEAARRAVRSGRALLGELAKLDQRAAEARAEPAVRRRPTPAHGRPAPAAPSLALVLLAFAGAVVAVAALAMRAPAAAAVASGAAVAVLAGAGIIWLRRGGGAARGGAGPGAAHDAGPAVTERARVTTALEEVARALRTPAPLDLGRLDDADAGLDGEWRARERDDGAARAVAGALASLDREQAALATAEQDAAAARAGWQSWAADRGLGDVTPDGGLELLATIAELAGRAAALDRVEWELRRSRDQLRAFGRDVAALAADAAMAGAVDGLDERAVLEVLRERADRAARADEELESLRTAVTEVGRQLAEQLGQGTAAEQALAELACGDVAGWEAERARLRDDLPALARAHEDAVRAHQDQARLVERVASSNAIARLELARAGAAEELRAELREWWTLGLARALVEETLGRYERERQPAVVGRAAALFAEITEGRYVHVVPRGGGDGRREHGIEVVDRAGRRIDAAALSRGTVEQLYLCLRLALAEVFAERTTPMPLVLDDVLVNFDPRRAAAVTRVLLEVATRTQILLFTCHPHVVEAVQACGRLASVVELDAGAASTVST
jgi:uncharacterized protein YhaN